MTKEIDNLADVLNMLTDWRMGSDRRNAPVDQEIESLRLIVVQMATALALHEVQIQKLREALTILASTRD